MQADAGRWGQVEELNGAAVFLASDASSFVNGQILYVDGGMTSTRSGTVGPENDSSKS